MSFPSMSSSVSAWFGRSKSPVIRIADLEGIPTGIERIIFKTRNSDLWRKPGFQTDYVYLDPDAAEWLVNRGIRLVGTDYLSVDKMKSGHATHTRLLQAGVIIVEGLDCSEVPEGTYTLVCLPLKIKGGDGAPARAGSRKIAIGPSDHSTMVP